MQVGSLVECTVDFAYLNSRDPDCEGRPEPSKGQIYHVAELFEVPILACIFYNLPKIAIVLQEMHPESVFDAKFFREVQPPMDITALIEQTKTETV